MDTGHERINKSRRLWSVCFGRTFIDDEDLYCLPPAMGRPACLDVADLLLHIKDARRDGAPGMYSCPYPMTLGTIPDSCNGFPRIRTSNVLCSHAGTGTNSQAF